MGLRFRKSINLGKGVKVNLSKNGIGYSVGTKGVRVSKTAKGTTRKTLTLPGTGLSYVTESKSDKSKNKTIEKDNKSIKDKTFDEIVDDIAMTDEAGDLIDETVTGVAKPVKVPVGTKASKNGTIDGKEGNANNPTIPKNYTPIDAGEATWGDGTSSPTQNAVDHGLVIKDDSDNEWVWIPVDSTTLKKMVETSTEAKSARFINSLGENPGKGRKRSLCDPARRARHLPPGKG